MFVASCGQRLSYTLIVRPLRQTNNPRPSQSRRVALPSPRSATAATSCHAGSAGGASRRNSGRSIFRITSVAQTILARPSAGNAISSASITSSAVAPSRSARFRYCRRPFSVCACTLVITEIRLRVFGSRRLPASFRNLKYDCIASGRALTR